MQCIGVVMSSYAQVLSRATHGMQSPLVTVEVHLANGLPALMMVGLPSTEVREAKERVRSALINSGYDFPAKRITINLAPADLPKAGGRYDLAIAIGILLASNQIDEQSFNQIEVIGELALSGEVLPITGVIGAIKASSAANHQLLLPAANNELAIVTSHQHLLVLEHIKQLLIDPTIKKDIKQLSYQPPKEQTSANQPAKERADDLKIMQVIGNHHAKRALMVAAAGQHNLLLMGAPGAGKSLLSSCLVELLPSLSESEVEQILFIKSLIAPISKQAPVTRPFRSPHHSTSRAALIGGGRTPLPGEVSLAHLGVLFLDELVEFNRDVLEALREPIETGQLSLSRANWKLTFPAQFQLIAAVNPCKCGYAMSKHKACRCSETQVNRYLSKLSGPLINRFDLQVLMDIEQRVCNEVSDFSSDEQLESAQLLSFEPRQLRCAQQKQLSRQGCFNAKLPDNKLWQMLKMPKAIQGQFKQGCLSRQLSFRAQFSLLKVALTLCDLMDEKKVTPSILAEAFSYRAIEQRL
jgi:magnesium chelatase family protein